MCSAGGYYRDTPILEEMIAAQQGTTAAGIRLIYAWDGWVCGKASAGGEVVDSGEGRPTPAECPFKVGDDVELMGAEGTVANPCKVSGVSHPILGQWSLYLVDMDGMCHVASADSCRRLDRPSVTTENGTFNVGDVVRAHDVDTYPHLAVVIEIDPTSKHWPIRVRLADGGEWWYTAEQITHA